MLCSCELLAESGMQGTVGAVDAAAFSPEGWLCSVSRPERSHGWAARTVEAAEEKMQCGACAVSVGLLGPAHLQSAKRCLCALARSARMLCHSMAGAVQPSHWSMQAGCMHVHVKLCSGLSRHNTTGSTSRGTQVQSTQPSTVSSGSACLEAAQRPAGEDFQPAGACSCQVCCSRAPI